MPRRQPIQSRSGAGHTRYDHLRKLGNIGNGYALTITCGTKRDPEEFTIRVERHDMDKFNPAHPGIYLVQNRFVWLLVPARWTGNTWALSPEFPYVSNAVLESWNTLPQYFYFFTLPEKAARTLDTYDAERAHG